MLLKTRPTGTQSSGRGRWGRLDLLHSYIKFTIIYFELG